MRRSTVLVMDEVDMGGCSGRRAQHSAPAFRPLVWAYGGAALSLFLVLQPGCGGSESHQRTPATAAPVAPTAQPSPEDERPCDPVVAALEQSFEGSPVRSSRPGGCGVQVQALRRADGEPAQVIRAAYPGWSEDLAQAASGPEGQRFTLEKDGVQCTTTFAWGPMGPDAAMPWTARVDCSRRPGQGAARGSGKP